MPDRPTAVALGGLAALAIAMGIGRFAFTPILPMMQADGLVSVVDGGWLASANYAGYLAGAATAASLRLATSHAIRIALAVVGVSTLAMGLAPAMVAWLALRFAAGVASAWVFVFSSAWCLERLQAECSADRRTLLGAVVFAGVGVGIAVAGTICVALLARHASSASAWITLGIVSLLAAGAMWNAFPPVAAAAPVKRANGNGWSAESLRLILCYGAFGFGYIIPATFLASMARATISDPALYGWSWPVFGAAAAASTLGAAALRRRLSDRRIWTLGHLAMAAGVVAPLMVEGLPGIALSALLVGGTFMVVTMAAMQEARRVAGERARGLMAAMTAAFAAGQIAGPLVVSALAACGGGFSLSLVIAGMVLVVSALALIAPIRPRRSP